MSVTCCVDCRLLQSADSCVACGGGAIALDRDTTALRHPLERIDERGTPKAFARGMKWLGIVCVWPLAVVVLAAREAKQRRDVIAGVKLPRAKGTCVYRGIAHPLSATDEPLVEETVLYRGDAVLFRRVRTRPFVVYLDDGGKIVVDGEVRMDLDGVSRTSADGPVFDKLGIPKELRVPATLGVATLRDGARVVVKGEATEEIRSELASYRDAGEAIVLRGRTGAVVAIATKS